MGESALVAPPDGAHPRSGLAARRDDPPWPFPVSRAHVMDRNDKAIRIDALARSFGVVRAVDGLTLEVPAGIVFGFLGPNGAGKTTTINLLLGLLEPTSGRAEVLGVDPWTQGEEVRRRTGAVL